MLSRKGTLSGSSLPIASWIAVGNVKLKFVKNYDGIPSLDVSHAIHFASCSFSGPLALAYSLSPTSWYVSIRTPGGVILNPRIEVPDVFSLEWTKGHRLVIVDRKGRAFVFSSRGQLVNDFHFDNSIREVKGVQVFTTQHDSGLAVLDDQLRLFVVNTVNEPIVWKMNTPRKEPPTAWTAIQPRSQLTKVIIAIGKDFYSGSQAEQLSIVETSWALQDGQYARMNVSFDHSRLALYHSSKMIQIVSSDLSEELCRIPVPKVAGEDSIYRFGWVGLESIFLQRTPTHTYFFDASNSEAVYDSRSQFIQIGTDCDGVRLFSDSDVTFVSPVSVEEKEVLGVASGADGALLNEASQWIHTTRSHQSYEYAKQISNMNLAIEQCISTACETWSPIVQKSLLNAARFGMTFASGYDSSRFVRVIRLLRVFNEIRSARLGIPISYKQFELLTESCLLNRLIDLEAYGMAVFMCEWLGREQQEGIDRVLLEWVRRTITEAGKKSFEMNMNALDEKIAYKLGAYPHVSLADAAMRAIDAQLPTLARLLIKREKDESKQVNVLLELNDVAEALSRAAATQRPQLLHQVLRHLMARQKRADFELIIRKIPMAQCLYEDLVRREDNQGRGLKMLALLEQASDFERQTLFHLDVAVSLAGSNRLDCLRRAKDAAHSIGDKGIDEVITDMTAFANSQVERNQDSLTIRETVMEHAADSLKVQMIKSQAKLTDKQVWIWTIEGLAKAGKMEQLFQFSQTKSPVGYVPFIKACMRYNRVEECKKYFPRVTGYQDLIAAHLAMNSFVSAAKMAFDRRDSDTLDRIYMKSHINKDAYAKVAQLISTLN